jgi:hypothetical protein
LRIGGLLPLLLALTASGAPSASPYETEYVVTGDVEPAGLAMHELKRGDVVFQQRLSFDQLAVADAALTQASNGEEFMPAGEQYFKAATEGPELWCTANMKMPQTAIAKSIVGRVYSQYCILDANKDGVFDSFFKRARTIPVLPNVRGKITPNPRPIRPLRLQSVDPATLRTSYYVGVAYAGAAGKGNINPLFEAFAGSEFGRFPMSGFARGTGDPTQRLQINGAVIEVASTAGGFSGKVIRPFGTGALRIRGTNCGLINGC